MGCGLTTIRLRLRSQKGIFAKNGHELAFQFPPDVCIEIASTISSVTPPISHTGQSTQSPAAVTIADMRQSALLQPHKGLAVGCDLCGSNVINFEACNVVWTPILTCIWVLLFRHAFGLDCDLDMYLGLII